MIGSSVGFHGHNPTKGSNSFHGLNYILPDDIYFSAIDKTRKLQNHSAGSVLIKEESGI
jgi:hypothetical protein